jgi:hypothetical protein
MPNHIIIDVFSFSERNFTFFEIQSTPSPSTKSSFPSFLATWDPLNQSISTQKVTFYVPEGLGCQCCGHCSNLLKV